MGKWQLRDSRQKAPHDFNPDECCAAKQYVYFFCKLLWDKVLKMDRTGKGVYMASGNMKLIYIKSLSDTTVLYMIHMDRRSVILSERLLVQHYLWGISTLKK